jgi:hypothetical protein
MYWQCVAIFGQCVSNVLASISRAIFGQGAGKVRALRGQCLGKVLAVFEQ